MNSEKDADLKLSPGEHSLLAQVLDQMEKLGGPVPALKFRVAKREQLQLLNDLEAKRWLKRDNDRYTVLSILLPLVDSEPARRQLAAIELVYTVLRQKYFESQQDPVKVVDIAAATGLPNEQALAILKQMADCTLWNAGWSLDVNIGDTYVNPEEKLIEFESFASMVKEVRSWWIWPVEERNTFAEAAGQPLASEVVSSSRATTQTLSLQSLPGQRISMATGGARTEQQINNAIGLLMEQVDALTAKSVDWEIRTDDVRLKVLVSSFHNAVREAFGMDSPEFREYGHIEMLAGPLRVGMSADDLYLARTKGRDYIVAVCGELIQRLQRKLRTPTVSGMGSTSTWHPKIAKAVADLIANGHPWEAVFAACKALVLHVRDRAGRPDLDGLPLMRTVFSKNAPILRFNAMANVTDADEQEGMMHLFEGAIMALRNPGGHSFPTGPDSRALQYIELISMLAERTDEATLSA